MARCTIIHFGPIHYFGLTALMSYASWHLLRTFRVARIDDTLAALASNALSAFFYYQPSSATA